MRNPRFHAPRRVLRTPTLSKATGAAKQSAGWRTIDGRRIYFRSRWEANYARWLELLRVQGRIATWEHEPETFWFQGIKRGTCSYLPDFRVTRVGGGVEYHEVKGYVTARARVALKRMAKYHPDVKLLVIGEHQFRRLQRDVGALVPGWE